jgi:hypothetical protein
MLKLVDEEEEKRIPKGARWAFIYTCLVESLSDRHVSKQEVHRLR